MKNIIQQIKGFTQGFLEDVLATLSSAFTVNDPVLAPIRVRTLSYYASKRNPYSN